MSLWLATCGNIKGRNPVIGFRPFFVYCLSQAPWERQWKSRYGSPFRSMGRECFRYFFTAEKSSAKSLVQANQV